MTVPARGKHPPDPPGHLDEVSLDSARAGEATAAADAHLSACATCRARLQFLTDLEAALAMPPPPVAVPLARDAAILALTGAVADRVAGRHRLRRVAFPGFVAAAVAAAAIGFLVLRSSGPSRPGPSYAAGDLNHDREVDILDAFALARALDRGDCLLADCDLNHDQVIDQSDVDAAASAAVALGERL